MDPYSGREWDDDYDNVDLDDPDELDQVHVPEPFRTLLRLPGTTTRRYDLRANIASLLGLSRRRSISVGTERFFDALCDSIATAWQMRNAPATRDRARGFVKDAFYFLPFDDVLAVMRDFGWGEMEIVVTPLSHEADLQRAAVGRMSKRVERLLAKAHAAHKRHAA